VKNLGVNYGFVFTAFGVAATIGPMLGSKMRDAFANYQNAYTISAIMLLAGAVLAFILKSPKLEPAPLPAGGAASQKCVGQAEVLRK
jgi:OFA family oxalate/formate antiporter-like MFS transporter